MMPVWVMSKATGKADSQKTGPIDKTGILTLAFRPISNLGGLEWHLVPFSKMWETLSA